METNLLFSNSKSGTFDAILQKLRQNLESDREQIVIVPDKFSLNAEKKIMEKLGLISTTKINVTSLDRIADSYCKNLKLTYLSKFGGIMLVQKILLDNLDKLQVFKKTAKHSGFCENLFNNLMLLKSCNVAPENLLKSVETLDTFSRLKITEIAFIYDKYEEYCLDRFYDSANKMTILKNQIKLDNAFNNVDFYYAMFDDYTPQALAVIQALSHTSHSQTFGLVQSNRTQKWDFFDDTATQKIQAIFEKLPNVQYSNNIEYFSPTKTIIEKFFGTKTTQVAPSGEELGFYQASSVQEELDFVAKSILYEVKTNSARFKQFNVAVSNLETLQPQIEHIFSKFNIPYFIDTQKSLSELLFPKFLLTIFDCLQNNFQQKDILSILKSPFIQVAEEQKLAFENYLIEYNIDNTQIFDKFENLDETNAELERVRQNICDYLNYFISCNENAQTVYDFCQNIENYIEKFNIEQIITDFCKVLENMGLITQNLQNSQSVASIKTILDQLRGVFSQTPISLKHFVELLSAGCDSMKVASAPNSVDQVFIGDANSSIFSQNDYFYFVNCIENAYPTLQANCGLIADEEINSMNAKILIEPTIKQINKKSTFNCYNNLFLYQKYAHFSYSLNSLLKTEQKPSSFLIDLLMLYQSENGKPLSFVSIPLYLKSNDKTAIILNNITPNASIKNILEFNLNPIQSVQEQSIYNSILYCLNNTNTKVNLDIENQNIKGNVINAQEIIKTKNTFSVTEIENYYSCPYMHFARYILKLKDKPQGKFQAFDIGNFLHKVAEEFFNYLISTKQKFLGEQDAEIIISQIVQSVETSDKFKNYFKYKETDWLLSSLINEAKRMCKALNEQAKHSQFQVAHTEFSFSIPFKNLGLDSDMQFYGKIDRLDEYGEFFRIVDYKTGSEKFSISNLYYGRKIQLQLYAYALSQKNKKFACGIFYSPIKDEFAQDKGKQNTKQEFYKLDGLMLEDASLALSQDDTLTADNPESVFIPIKFSKSNLLKTGEYIFDHNSSKVCDKETFYSELDYARLSLLQAIKEIQQGNIEPSPYKEGQSTPCTYCPFSVACGFDEQKQNNYRELEKFDFEKIIKEISDGINAKSNDSN